MRGAGRAPGLDERAGLDTATFVSGYPARRSAPSTWPSGGSATRLEANRIVHRPGPQRGAGRRGRVGLADGRGRPYAGVDGVVGAWYGKGPGLDRCGDVLKHANFMGTGPNGGAVLFVGDDPAAKSSTLPYDTNAAARRRRRPDPRAR